MCTYSFFQQIPARLLGPIGYDKKHGVLIYFVMY